MKTNASEPLMTCRNVKSDVETRIWISILRARVGKRLLIAQPASGMKAA
jgi:type IV pilus biogenesis protein CpaD/CtpE